MYNITISGQVSPTGVAQNLVAKFSSNQDKNCRLFNVHFDVECVNDDGEVVKKLLRSKDVVFNDLLDVSTSNIVDVAVNAARYVNNKLTADILNTFYENDIRTTFTTDVLWKENVDCAVKIGVKAAA